MARLFYNYVLSVGFSAQFSIKYREGHDVKPMI